MIRLGVNIDHIATIRNARGELFPSVLEAALIAETNGADLITAHLREDRRHIKDEDIFQLKQNIKTELNLEMAATEEMLKIALEVKPKYVCLVPEKRQELTTEGGLDVSRHLKEISYMVSTLQDNGILVALFVDPDSKQITAARETNAYSIELHTGKYASAANEQEANAEYYRIKDCSELADSIELVVNAGHGLNYKNVRPIAKLPHIRDLNIGFSIVAQSVFWGLAKSVYEMKQIIILGRD